MAKESKMSNAVAAADKQAATDELSTTDELSKERVEAKARFVVQQFDANGHPCRELTVMAPDSETAMKLAALIWKRQGKI